MEKIKCSTPDFAKENAKKLLALFPECEGQKGEVDIDKLRQLLSSTVIEGNVERYQFTWPGKRAAMAAASAATTKTLRPCAAESVGRDGTPGGFDSENLYIEGDNLEVLKLLQTSYAGKVKMIYIDPPYNTGHDFVYRDRFSLTQKELDDNAGAFDEDGNRFEVNDSAEARYHSNWCSMMYPRLKLARNLLRDDGVIFISIDDNEVTNLRKLCDEVFGEPQFVAQIVWQKRTSPDARTNLGPAHDYIIVYAKVITLRSEALNLIPLSQERQSQYQNPDNDPRGVWASVDVTGQTGHATESQFYEITTPGGTKMRPPAGRCWAMAEKTFLSLVEDNRIWFGSDGNARPRKKIFLSEVAGGTAWTWWPHAEVGNNQDSAKELKGMFGSSDLFENPKPTKLLYRILQLGSNRDSLVLDFFSGSATTAHAVVQLNAEDGGHRKFIMVQLPEPCDEDSEASTSGYKNICEIGKERIRRAGTKIAEENAITAPNLDIGFRVLKLDTSSLRDTSATVSETNQEFANFERVRSDRSAEDLLFQMLLETHIPLSESIVKAKVAGNEMLFVGVEAARSASAPYQNAPLAACLDARAKMTTEFFIEIAKLKPGIAFFRDDAFVDDSARTNLQQVFNQFSPTTSIKVI
ncbi:MAG: site-specific DNA-methyltransferase [Kiritimatiellae bacterium]|nr:site-specific DNA-methyltransferase [Kiritimatiellia bacterium]